MPFVALGAVAGLVLAVRRYRFFLLVPIVGFLAAGALLVGIVHGSNPSTIAAEVFGAITAPQLAFVGVSLADYLVRWRRLIPTLLQLHEAEGLVALGTASPRSNNWSTN